jgi:hypothetical protein
MPARRSHRLRQFTLLLMLLVVTSGVIWLTVTRSRKSLQKQALLIAPGNAQELYADCEELWRNKYSYRPDTSWHPSGAEHPDLMDPQLPLLIRKLEPVWIDIRDDSVEVECGGKVGRYGIVAFIGGARTQPNEYRVWRGVSRARALLPGLYYYSDDNRP